MSVTKYIPSEHKDNSDNYHVRSNNRHHHHRNSNKIEQPDRIISTSTDRKRLSCGKNIQQNSSDIVKKSFLWIRF